MSKEEIKNLLLSFGEEDYQKSVDLHIHSNFSDGKLKPEDLVKQALKLEKKHIAIADHNTIDAYLSTNILKEHIIIPAVEFDCFYMGNIIHILGYGINIDSSEIKSVCAKSYFGRKFNIIRLLNLRNPKEVIEKIKQSGGIAVLAHPACYFCKDFDLFVKGLVDMGLEGIEVYYLYRFLRKLLKFNSIEKIKNIADKYNLIKTGGTDTHGRKLLSL